MDKNSDRNQPGIFEDPRTRSNYSDELLAVGGEPQLAQHKSSTEERRNGCFSNAPWWLKRNYLDQN